MHPDDVLSGSLEALRRATRSTAARRRIRHVLGAMLAGDARLGTVRLRRAKFKPGRKLTLHLDAKIRWRNADVVRPLVIVWRTEASGGHQDPDLEAEAVHRGLAGPFRRLASDIPAWNADICVAPLDPRLPQLLRLSDPSHVEATLGAQPRSDGEHDSLVRIDTVRYRPGQRHVLRYQLRDRSAPPRVVFAKLSVNEDVERAFILTAHAADLLDRSGTAVSVARPMAVVTGDDAILIPEVPGRPLSGFLRRGDATLEPYLQQVAHALRALHGGIDPFAIAVPVRTSDAEVDSTRRASEHVSWLLPEVGDRIGAILERARNMLASLPSEAPTFVHGDAKADHVLIGPSGTTLLDFGACGMGDPAMDVGNFLADMEWWRSPDGRGDAGPTFLDGFGPPQPRARVWAALLLIRITAHRVPLFDRAWPDRTMRLIDRAERFLENAEDVA